MRNEIKIVTRLCKEAGLFPGRYYTNIINFIEENNSYIFYGKDNMDYCKKGVEFEAKMLRLQFDILQVLIECDLLESYDYNNALIDTLHRYDVTKATDYPWLDNWKTVSIKSGKKEFIEFFFKAYEKKLGEIKKSRKAEILRGLPR